MESLFFHFHLLKKRNERSRTKNQTKTNEKPHELSKKFQKQIKTNTEKQNNTAKNHYVYIYT